MLCKQRAASSPPNRNHRNHLLLQVLLEVLHFAMSICFETVGGNYLCPPKHELEELCRNLHAHLVVKGRHQPYYGIDCLVDRNQHQVGEVFMTVIRLISRMLLKDNPVRICTVRGLREAIIEAAGYYNLGSAELIDWIFSCKVGSVTFENRLYHSYVSAMDAGMKGLIVVMKALRWCAWVHMLDATRWLLPMILWTASFLMW
jgi:hypothetical protein